MIPDVTRSYQRDWDTLQAEHDAAEREFVASHLLWFGIPGEYYYFDDHGQEIQGPMSRRNATEQVRTMFGEA